MSLTISAFPHGTPAVGRLASLTNADAPDAPVLVAQLNGEPVAALGLLDGRLVCDPVRAGRRIAWRLRVYRFGIRTVVSVWGV